MTIVQVRWYGPYRLDYFDSRDIASYNGIYAIYRVFGGKESLLYIGKTGRSFKQRINEHNRNWLVDVRGEIKVRFGLLAYPNGKKHSIYKLNDTESLLIHWHSPSYNTLSRKWYRGRSTLTILNVGRRGSLEKIIKSSVLF